VYLLGLITFLLDLVEGGGGTTSESLSFVYLLGLITFLLDLVEGGSLFKQMCNTDS
jgi:hypothetical protein